MTTRHRLSPHFVVEDFDGHNGRLVPAAALPALEELCRHMLEPLRAKYGPAHVNSGYRDRDYNASIGGAQHSQHIYDQHPRSVAADVTFATGSVNAWARSARWRFTTRPVWRRHRRGGIGTYRAAGFTHLDSGPRRDWDG